MSEVKLFPDDEVSFRGSAHQGGYYMRLVESIRQAKKCVYVCQYVFSVTPGRSWQRSNKVLAELVRANGRGVVVCVLFDRPKARSPNSSANVRTAKILSDAGVSVRCLAVNKTLHIKLVVIDSKILFAGSHNLTNSSLYSPFELSFECCDDYLANAATVYFNCLWNGALSEDFGSVVRFARYGDC